MATVPKETLEQFKQKYPNVSEEAIREAALSAGVINGGITQVRALVVRNILENKGHLGEADVRQLFPNDNPLGLIREYYEEEEHH